ncbi:MAG: hypothetical protein ACRDS0_04765 [Pseudonocardiaceae bacterium]
MKKLQGRVKTAAMVGLFAATVGGVPAASASTADSVNNDTRVSKESTIVAQSCGGSAWAPPGGEYMEYKSPVATAGSRGFQKGYTFGPTNNDVNVSVLARGFDENGKEQWYFIGYGNRGGGGSVLWGNNLAYPAIKVRSTDIVRGTFLDWGC